MYDQVGLGKGYHNDNVNSYPDAVKEEYARLCEWVKELGGRYKDNIFIRIIDTNSVGGVFKSVRHWVRKYPVFIINNKVKYLGWDKRELDSLIQTHMVT